MSKSHAMLMVFTLSLFNINTLATTQPFTMEHVKFQLDNAFYQYGTVIRCEHYTAGAEEVPAAICCHYNNSVDKFYFTGSEWTCPKIQNAIGELSYNCDTSNLSSANSKDYMNTDTTAQMVSFCKQK